MQIWDSMSSNPSWGKFLMLFKSFHFFQLQTLEKMLRPLKTLIYCKIQIRNGGQVQVLVLFFLSEKNCNHKRFHFVKKERIFIGVYRLRLLPVTRHSMNKCQIGKRVESPKFSPKQYDQVYSVRLVTKAKDEDGNMNQVLIRRENTFE